MIEKFISCREGQQIFRKYDDSLQCLDNLLETQLLTYCASNCKQRCLAMTRELEDVQAEIVSDDLFTIPLREVSKETVIQ